MSMDIQLLMLVGGGLLAGLVGALMGLGGGLIAVPFVNLVIGINIHTAAAAGLVSTLAVSCGAAGRYLRKTKLIDISTGLRVQLFTATGGFLGGVVAGWLKGAVIQLLFAGVLMYAAGHIVHSAKDRPNQSQSGHNVDSMRMWIGLFVCFLAGNLAGLLGIGGGIIVVPVLHIMMSLPFKNSIATSNFIMGLTAVPALSGYISRGQLDLFVSVPIAMGVLAGASLGAYIMPRIKTNVLKIVFTVILVIISIGMARQGFLSW
jgi:uncharacterized membrane protein YfcA